MTDDQIERVAIAIGEALAGKDLTDEALIDAAEDAIKAMQGQQGIENAPYNTPVLGIVLMIPDSDQLKGIRSGWLKLPNALPFVCKRMPEDEEYNEYWCQLDCYGEIIDADDFAPTHFMALPSLPKKG